ncbi:MAG: Iron-sulfur flavoprotein [Methanomassiliicoccales archaeon PtaU1.Bin124]|nr:MAG: Iron-sulfur flavoprotein [Methanomassiliicoccales archaeon PtaU1.Bin124]
MEVIGIVSSPRRNGNTDKLVQSALDGASSAGHKTRKINLNDLNFKGCQACNYCRVNDGCKQKDDLIGVLDAIRNADAVVFGVPIYMGQLNGEFRLFEDRMFSFIDASFHSRLKPGKKAIIITSQGNGDAKAFEQPSDDLAKILAMSGFKVTDIIRMSNGNSPSAIDDRKELLDMARSAGIGL